MQELLIATPWNEVNYIPLIIVSMFVLSCTLKTTLRYAFSPDATPKLMTASHIDWFVRALIDGWPVSPALLTSCSSFGWAYFFWCSDNTLIDAKMASQSISQRECADEC